VTEPAAFPGPGLDAVVFDMDGVVTQTALVHAAAWKRMFDDALRERAGRTGTTFVRFDDGADYLRYIDGMPRYDGVRRFLASRGIELPEGTPADDPSAETVCGLGNRKNGYFLAEVAQDGVLPFPGTVALIRSLRDRGTPVAIISASENATAILRAAGVLELFDAQVDGTDAARAGLAGKPDPAIFVEAARRLGVLPARTVVVEDALAGVEAGRRGGFGLVVGVDRHGHPEDLAAHGADIVIGDLAELLPAAGPDAVR
jgi:beta-phosphoglucomutase family hydrolase